MINGLSPSSSFSHPFILKVCLDFDTSSSMLTRIRVELAKTMKSCLAIPKNSSKAVSSSSRPEHQCSLHPSHTYNKLLTKPRATVSLERKLADLPAVDTKRLRDTAAWRPRGKERKTSRTHWGFRSVAKQIQNTPNNLSSSSSWAKNQNSSL